MLHTHSRRQHTVLLGVLLGCLFVPSARAQTNAADDTTRSVQRMLERLPYYGAFDYIAFGVDDGVVTLVGYAYHPTLKAEAEMVARMVPGVKEVSNRIEVLPASLDDDRIRWRTFYRIYADDFLSRYVSGGKREVVRLLVEDSRFPGLQPLGAYPIHIIVKNGRTMLFGVVDTALERLLAETRAREVDGVFSIENAVMVAEQMKRSSR